MEAEPSTMTPCPPPSRSTPAWWILPMLPLSRPGKTVSNCATVTGTTETYSTSCASVTMTTPAPNFGFWHYISNPGSAPYLAGSKIQYTVAFGINAQSSTAQPGRPPAQGTFRPPTRSSG